MMWRLGALVPLILVSPALHALDQPWIGDTYFYWYTWNYEQELGGWMGGVYNTPLRGYYDSPRYEDNLTGLRHASEWGLTHHFMDYWGPGWQGEDGGPREAVLMRAAEDLRRAGYDTWMSVYQDGTDFDMAEFSKNLDPGRDTEFYVQRYAKSPATPTIGGKPVYLIYGRNGAPKITGTDEGFRDWLKAKYGTIEALNRRWGTNYSEFANIGFQPGAKGHLRADSIKYQYQVWAEEMARANRLAQERFGLPGIIFSWDVAFQPYQGWSYSDQVRVFGGPHSYAGIFAVPHQDDAERFIQAAVAKRYGTVFFDTFKNFYHDWEIRIPGICYPPDFAAFDRFWVQVLSHYSEALLHLSWNEWWEGSNLEPCYEYGKTYCEKNLLYATIMKQCFPSIQKWNAGARVAVLLNDWHWLAGGQHPEDIYACIQALRRANIRFDLLPDDFVTAEELGKFGVVLAPAAGTGFGYNAADEPIGELLLQWAQGAGRKLIVDDYPGLAEALQLRPRSQAAADQAPKPGADMNVFVDVGEEGDNAFLVEGASGREDWGKLPPGKFGATSGKLTVRWTPAAGNSTTFRLPLSPYRDHVLRLAGSTLRENQVTVLVDGVPAAEFALAAGPNECEVTIPAAAVGGRAQAEVTLQYAKAIIPKEVDPAKYDYESRVCNLALDWLQLATAGTPLSRKQNYKLPQAGVKFAATAPGQLKGKTVSGAYVRHLPLEKTPGTFSTYVSDGTARDVVTGPHGNILYVNGLLSALEDHGYLRALLLDWAGLVPELRTHSDDVMVTPLRAGDTDILLAYNYAAPEERQFMVSPPPRPGGPPMVELRCLSRDGSMPAQPDLAVADQEDSVAPFERVKYYGVYQATRGWVKPTTPPMALVPGQTASFRLKLQGLRDVSGRVSLISHLPSLTSDTASFTVKTGRTVEVPLTLTCRSDADWGKKTVIFDVEVDGAHSYFWRTLMVQRRPELRLTAAVADDGRPEAVAASVAVPWAADATAQNVRLTLPNGSVVALGDVPPGSERRGPLAIDNSAAQPELRAAPATLTYDVGGTAESREVTLPVACYPQAYPAAPEAVAPLIVANPHDEYLENHIVSTPLTDRVPAGKPAYVRDGGGNVVPSQVVDGRVYWVSMLPPKSATLYYLCAGEAPQPATDLVVRTDGGKTVLSNSRLTLEWDGTHGGTVTRFVSAASGKDYAAGSFGGGWGTWGKYDPKAPTINAVDFVRQERKIWQREGSYRAQIEVLRAGPVLATIQVRSKAGEAWCTQTYTLGAYRSDFTVGGAIQAPRQTQELVPLDIRLARQGLTKIFPNFTGIAEGFTGDQPHAGWREAPYIPPYASIMAPDAFAESVSVIPEAHGLMAGMKFRQGFWPNRRPDAGPVDFAEIEFACTNASRAVASAHVLLHPGHQVVAKAFRTHYLDHPPVVIAPTTFRWEGEIDVSAAPEPADWWNPYWHYALPVTIGPLTGDVTNRQVVFRPDLQQHLAGSGTLDPASPRAVVRTATGFVELPTVYEAQTGEVAVSLVDAAWPSPPPARREITLYFDTLANGPKRLQQQVRPQAQELLDGSFEGTEYWQLGGGATPDAAARTGQKSVRLEWKADRGPVVVVNDTFRLHPNSSYRVSFWAKTTSPGAAVRCNFYAGAAYDFPQTAIDLAPDGQWHQYETILPTGDFPWGVRPALRFWVMDHPQVVWLDDVAVQAIVVPPKPELPVVCGDLRVR